ncbi:MAG TPA: FG-GAP-like repeat-containing protein, partial [Pyrinomonadaceae bacterium]|nr:FG-GAP-like repeat-containing protein [Pyrinomonadaceae bacterium]
NGDGNADLVIGNGVNVEGELAIYLGNGAGGFGPRIQKFIVGGLSNRISGVGIGDFNGDGKQDVVVSSSTFSNVSILTGDGTGNVTFLRSVAAGGGIPNFLLVRDVNNDSKPDVLVTNTSSSDNNVTVLLGDGAGNFAAGLKVLSGASPGSFDVADLDGDNKLDLAVTLGTSVSILRGDGAGNFGNATNFSLNGNSGASPKAADFNADGKLDLALVTPAGYLMIALGDGSGGFQLVASFIGFNPSGFVQLNPLAIADFNGDTRPDAAVGNNGNNKVSTLLNFCGLAVPAQIQLNSNSSGWAVIESDGAAIMSVVRSGDITGAASVQYATRDWTAVSSQDYTAVSGTLNFAAGEISKSVTIPLINDGIPESVENFSLELMSVSGAILVDPSSTNIFIIDDDTSQVLFTSSTLAVNEGDGVANVSVSRTGNTNLAGSVDYATSDTAGTTNCSAASTAASARCDYTTVTGTLSFAPGEIEKFISVPIIDDSYVEGTEHFTLTLSNPKGAGLSLGSRTTTDVSISNNDSTTGPNPLDAASVFVRQNYLDFLSRPPDQSGLNFWMNQITSCGSDAACTEVKRINVSAAFFLSIEFQQTGYLVERFYKVAYGEGTGTSTLGGSHPLAVPAVRFNEFLTDTQRIGRGVVVLQPGWEQALENNKQAYAGEFVATSRFVAAFPTMMIPADFVDKLNRNAGNVLSPSERTTAINLFSGAADTSNTTSRAQALRQVAEDQDLYNAEFNRAFVLTEFFGYLRRNPNDTPDMDHTGYEFWLGKLNQFNGDYIAAEMVKAFISSSEYRQRFGP